MIALIVLIFTLVLSWIVVRIGAIAFQLTGLEWSLAKFQSLSCFSGTGFTTRESELIVSDKRRRRIASVLMVLGNAGLVTLIASAAGALNPDQSMAFFEQNFLNTPINIVILAVAIYLVYKLLNNKKITGKLTRYLRKRIKKEEFFQPVSFEELLQLTGGYGISRIEVCEGNPLIDKTLFESELRKNDITVLAIIRDNETIPNPSANRKILKGDGLISFGKLENIRNQACSP